MISILYNQDCLKFALEKADASYELIIADPPYNEIIEAEWDNQWHNDGEYLDWLNVRIKEFSRLLTHEGNLLLYCKRQFLPQIRLFCDSILKEQRTIIWIRRRNMDVTRGKTLASGYEPIVWYSKSDDFIFNFEEAKVPPEPHLQHRSEYQKGGRLEKGVGLTDAWNDIPALPHNSPEKTKHPTQKPLKLAERIVKLFSSIKGTVYIPFAGSGAEIIACHNLNRQWDGTEINKKYIEIINQRLNAQNTKLEAFLQKSK